jgi:imidazolonepropionase-like amidohydrolase
VADKIGSLEVGKLANIIVTTGDPLEPKTQIKYLFIDGWIVPLDSRHIQLYEEFLNRSPGLKK